MLHFHDHITQEEEIQENWLRNNYNHTQYKMKMQLRHLYDVNLSLLFKLYFMC